MPSGLEYEISVKNNSGPALEQHAQNLNRARIASQQLSEKTDKFGRGFHEGTRSVEVMSNAIVGRLNPALGGLIGNISQAARVATSLPVALGATTIAVAAVSAGIGIYIDRLKEAQTFAAAFSQARLAGDLGSIRSLLDENTKAWALYRTQLEEAQKPVTGMVSAFDSLITKIQVLSTNTAELTRRQIELSKTFPGLLGNELGIASTRLAGTVAGGQRAEAAARMQIGVSRGIPPGDISAYTQSQLEALTRQMNAEQEAAGYEVADLIKKIEASNLDPGAKASSTAFYRAFLDRQREAIAAAAGPQRTAIGASGRAAILGFQTQRSTPGTFGEPDFTVIPRILGHEGDAAILAYRQTQSVPGQWGEPDYTQIPQITGREQDSALARAALQSERDRLQVLRDVYGLTQQEHDARALLVIEADKLLKLSADGLTIDERKVINLEAQAKSAGILRAEFERTNALGGLAKGFRDAAEAAESSGQIMQDFARQTALSMQHSFSDLFFNVITGQFKNMEDVFKQLGLSLARNFTDMLGQAASAPILRGLAQGGSALSNYFFPDSGMSLLNIAPGSVEQVASLQRAGYSIGGAGTYASAPGARAGAGQLYPNLYYQGSVSPGAGGAGGGFGIGPGEGEGLATGLNANAYAGLGIGATALGLSILASNSSGTNAAAFSAAATGLTAGAGLATLLGASATTAYGIGSLVAVAAMVAAVGIMDATDPKNPRPRTGERMAYLIGVLGDDARRVQQAGSFLDLAAAIQGAMHMNFGGPSSTSYHPAGFPNAQSQPIPTGRGSGMSTAGYAISIAGQTVILPGGIYPPTMTLAEFALLLETSADTFTARLQLGIDAGALSQINQNFEQVVKDQARIIAAVGASRVAYAETGPGLLRTTILPLSAIGTVEAGRYALSLDRSTARDAGLTDAQIDMLTKRVLARNSQTDRMPDWSREPTLVI